MLRGVAATAAVLALLGAAGGARTFLLFWPVLARVGGVFAVAPVVSSTAVPAPVRAALSVLLSLAVLPAAAHGAAAPPAALLPYVALVGHELLVGLTIGFLARLTFSAAEMAGSLVDLQMGFAVGSLVDPVYGEATSVLGTLLETMAMLLYLLAGGLELLVLALAGSFARLPLGAPTAFAGPVGALTAALGAATLTAVQVTAPVLAFGLVLNLALGLVGRAMPQLNVLQSALPAQVLGGLGAMLLALPVLTAVFGGLAQQAAGAVGGLLP